MRVLIAGCGDVGNVLAERLLQDGHTVFGLKRDVSTLPDGVLAIASDLTQPASLADLPANLNWLVFMPTPEQRTEAAYKDIFIQGWTNLWNALPQPPHHCLLVSSTSVYAQSDGSWVNEQAASSPDKFNGRVLLEMEALARVCCKGTVVARLSGIYGPGRERLIQAASSADAVKYEANGFNNRIHIDDAGAALAHLLCLDNPKELYLVSDDLPVAKYDVVSWLAKKTGHPAPARLPLQGAASGKRVSNQRLRESGYRFKYPDYKAGYSAILQLRNQNEFSG